MMRCNFVPILVLACTLVVGCVMNNAVTSRQAAREFAPDPGSTLSVFTAREPGGTVLFLGTWHSFSEANPQLPDIARLFSEFAPTVVLIEGGAWDIEPTASAAIKSGGEMGFATYLADKAKVPTKTFEPAFADEIAHVLTLHNPQDAKLYYALREVSQMRAQDSSQSMDAHESPAHQRRVNAASIDINLDEC